MSRPRHHPRTVFDATGLSKFYQMGEVTVKALQDVNLQLNEGEFIVLLGPSGSGKSTLLNILGGLDTPTTGEVRFLGQDLFGDDDNSLTLFRRNHVGFVFQFYNLIPSLTTEENVALVTDLNSNSLSTQEALELVDLWDRRDHFPAQLSGGEQQRVAIARAIAKKPDLLLCDEPTGALDFKTGRIVLEAIHSVNERLGTTTIVITHNASIAAMADRVVQMRDGKIVSNKKITKKVRAADLKW